MRDSLFFSGHRYLGVLINDQDEWFAIDALDPISKFNVALGHRAKHFHDSNDMAVVQNRGAGIYGYRKIPALE